MPNDKLKKLESLIKLVDESITREEFVRAFEAVIKQILAIEKSLIQKIDTKIALPIEEFKFIKNELKKVQSQSVQDKKDSQKEFLKIRGELVSIVRDVEQRVLKSAKNASDLTSDEFKSIKDTITQVDKKITNSSDFVRSENLKEIKNLQEEIKKLRTEIVNTPRGRGGGSRKTIYIKRIDLTSQCNGVLKSFAVPKDTISVIGVFGTQFPITFDTADFTLLGNTLTLTSEVSAPETGQTLFALVETLFY